MDEDDDEREAASIARSLKNTEPYSDEELAEQAERARQNKVERIMAPPTPTPPAVIYRQRDDALLPASEATIRRAAVEARVKETGRVTTSDRKMWWAARCVELQDGFRKSARRGFDGLTVQLALVGIEGARARERLELRVAALEAMVKPRVRVAAGRREI